MLLSLLGGLYVTTDFKISVCTQAALASMVGLVDNLIGCLIDL